MTQSIDTAGASIGQSSAKHFELFWRDLMTSGDTYRNDDFFRLITGEQHPLGNFAFLADSESLRGLEDAVAPLLDVAAPSGVFMAGEADELVAGRLNGLGYSRVDPMPAMAVDLDALTPTELPAGYEFVRVMPGDTAAEWTDVLALGYPLPRGLAYILSPEALGTNTAPDASLQFFAVLREGKVVATSMTYLAGGLAGVYCVATLAEERGKGLGAHVTAEALRCAQALGYRVGVLQSSEAGHTIYQSLGFRDVGEVHAFMRMPDSFE
jgi:ribosomal protein S18 acetylase RimI-like enzyme